MSSILIAWLAVLGASGLYWALSRKDLARRLFIVVVSLFVGTSLVVSTFKEGRFGRSEPVLEADKAEMLLRFGTSMKVLETSFKSISSTSSGNWRDKDFHDEASGVLEEAIRKSPDSTALKVKLAIVLADSGKEDRKAPAIQLMKEVAARKSGKESALGRTLLDIYTGKGVVGEDLTTLQRNITGFLPQGWYRDAALMRLYKVSGDVVKYDRLVEDITDRGGKLWLHMLTVMLVGLGAALIGGITVLVQLFTMPRKIGRSEDEGDGPEAVPWDLKTVYVVLVFWLATQILVGGLAQSLVKSLGLLTSGALTAALATALIYIVSNGPGILYIYLIALKPRGITLFDGLRLHKKVGSVGPVRLVLCGMATWCVAIPAVMLAYLLAAKVLGAQGSSNPIIALVLEAARSSNYAATILFYLTLGVLAPLCEESLFRGFLYRSLRKRLGVGTALIVSAALFSVVHMDVGALVPLMVLGWLFGFVFERTRSLLPAMVAHGMWNSGTFTLVILIFGS